MEKQTFVVRPVLFPILICLLFATGVLSVQAAKVGEKVNAGSNVVSAKSLQKIIDRAERGETIQLKPGIYKGPVRIDKPLALAGSKETVVDGGGNGHVIAVHSGDVTIQGLTIQNSGKRNEDSGIFVDDGARVILKNNVLKDVHFGVYIKNGTGVTVSGNEIIGGSGHFSAKGNGIHIFKGTDNVIENNCIEGVQDGIYFDFAYGVDVRGNEIRHSRYGMHYMFSEKIKTENNLAENNMIGFMIMDSGDLEFTGNKIYDQFHFRGFGIYIYQSKDILFHRNEIVRNSVGISFEWSENSVFRRNLIAANQIGLQFRKENGKNVFTENNFVGNIVSSAVGGKAYRLDDGRKGNYWDDYKGYDTDGDGIGDNPYRAGSVYDALLKWQPHWQFYFESPAVMMWTRAEAMFPTNPHAPVYDDHPLVRPVRIWNGRGAESGINGGLLLSGLVMFAVSLAIFLKGRKGI